MGVACDEGQQGLERVPDAHVDEHLGAIALLPGEAGHRGRIALVGLEAPHEARGGVCHRVDRVESRKEPGHLGGIASGGQPTDVHLGKLVGHSGRP